MASDSGSILVVTQYFPPETGAAQTRWDELTKRWSDEQSITVITSAPDYPEGELYEGYTNEWLQREQRGDVDVWYTKTVTSPSGNLFRRALKFIWFMIASLVVGLRYTSPSAVVATSPQPLTGVSAWIIARVHGGTFVFEVRDLWPESVTAVSDFDNRAVIWTLERTVRFLYRRCDDLIVVSKAFIDPIVACGVDESKIAFHPNGIDPDFYQVRDEGSSDDTTEDTFTVSYVGTIGRAHGLSVILDAATALPNVEFVIVGDGAERETLQARAADLDNVVFTGRKPKAEVPCVLARSDAALVHLKPREIFETVIPSKMLEAMAAELPVILGVKGESERILREADAGVVVEPGDAEDLTASIRRLRDDPAGCQQFARSGRSYVVDHFDWDTIATEYLANISK